MDHSLYDPGLASPPSPYDDPTPCPECGVEDMEYGEHEEDCPSGYPTKESYDSNWHPVLGPGPR